ncbi:binding-protein-dependent transport systems inner membrane component [Gloeothece citriformis PCC 7424]|uniref:Binding-protein-dependent transport systems inner membrane component n=1 Tax=Gloeothece citriformis (strain PCC 7424) TaxID=65393 RepID=B7K843_GLOC7|nr:ABC transporter permease subunit [Gloeothece citriformis]ACK68531.1 binding-protein-dependent transport systems inner membrane component [Gloeothece citriformis PCC 7424]
MTVASSISKNSNLKPSVFWRIGEDIPRSLYWILMGSSILVPLLIWQLICSFTDIKAVFLPSPLEVCKALIRLGQQGLLFKDTWISVFRVLSGFFLGAILSIPLGISMGAFASIRALFEPIIGVIRYMPAPAFTPLLLIYLGIDEPSKIALIFLGTVFFNTLMIMDSVKFIPKELIEVSYTLGGNRWQVLRQVISPFIVPKIIDTFRINMAAAWNLVVVAELVAAETGLGKRILLAQKFLKTDEIFACLIVLGMIGFAIDLSFRLLARLTCQWSMD